MTSCCPSDGTPAALLSAARCLRRAEQPSARRYPCEHNVTHATSVEVLGLQCVASRSSLRGFFLVSQAASGAPVCTGGDTYRVWAIEARRQKVRFSTYANPVADVWPNLYFADVTGASAALAGQHTLHVSMALLETQNRSLQRAKTFDPLVGARCLSHPRVVPLPAVHW